MGIVTVLGRDSNGNNREFSVSDLLDSALGINTGKSLYRDSVAGWTCVNPTSVVASPIVYTWSIAGGASVATDIGQWYVANQNATLTGGFIAAKTAPIGALPGLTYDIKYSRSGGAFASIFAAGNIALHDSQSSASFTLSTPFSLLLSDILRIDCTAVGLSTAGSDVVVQLFGTVTN